jgi:hypothetical protein
MSVLAVAVSALAIGCVGLILVGVSLLIEVRRSRVGFEIALRGLTEQHRMAFEVLAIDLNNLKDRVGELELRA